MKQYIEILSLAEQNKLPNKIDDSTNIPLHIFNELVEADYIKAIVSKTLNPKELGFLNAKITSKGREYLYELKRNSHFPNIANDIISSEIEKRNISLQDNIEYITNKTTERGFLIPPGSMFHDINNACISELTSRSKFIWETLLKVTENHPNKNDILLNEIKCQLIKQYIFIKEFIENRNNEYISNFPQLAELDIVENGLIELRQEYDRLNMNYQAKAKLYINNADEKLTPKPPEIFHRWFILSIKIIIGLATFLGLVVTLYSLSARVAVTSDSPINPEKPFSSPFTVSNQGILPIYDVLFSCTLRNVKWKDGGVINIRTKTDAAPIKRINAGEATTTFCKFLPYRAKIESADIEVEINYRPAYLFWSKRSSIRFGTVIESNGTLRWVPRALSE